MLDMLNNFKRFEETIFYKNHSELEDRIKYLKKLLIKYPGNEKIKSTLKFCEIGLQGEKEIRYELKNCNIGMYVLHDINLEFENSKSQIDYIIITAGYIYFVECKNLIGNITVDENGQFIREYTYDDKFIRESIYSPLAQAQKHIDLFKKIWKNKHNKLRYNILNIDFDKIYKPLVVMTYPKNILNLKYAPSDIKKYVVRSDELVNYIKKDISNYNKDELFTQKMMCKNAYNLMAYYNRNIIINYEELFNYLINDNNREEIKKNLLYFREKKHLERNIPSEYIFDDVELNLILVKMPKSYEELEKENILKPIKLKLHGREIIDIINSSRE